MSLADIDRQRVLAAIAEYDELGSDGFNARYGVEADVRYVVVHSGREYSAVALASAAHETATGQVLRGIDLHALALRLTELRLEFRDLDAEPSQEDRARYGELPGIPEGTTFRSRVEASERGVHRARQSGIVGTGALGAESIVVSGGYEDDVDNGTEIIYTGHGGRDSSGKQVEDQNFQKWGNAALRTSMITGAPVRVVRGPHRESPHAPRTGYRYDGLFRVVEAGREEGRRGYLVCRFQMVKLASALDVVIPPSEVTIPGVEHHPAPPEGSQTPGRRSTTTQRLVRRTAVADYVKNLHDHKCQACGTRLTVRDQGYSEGAHIQALGGFHCGPDLSANMLCLCPNCHVLFDYGVLTVQDDYSILRDGVPDGRTLRTHPLHVIGKEYLAHHREAHS
ncbi:YDG/SRA domain-containing protein [Amycolatopsis sp. NPDC059027]|uniref:YDG/SRA domain-containing protein n=1 Tax=Amycolatopsis sp. NPDC059027 TaxID=3346709 RepID=UPI00366EA6FF